MFWGVVDLEWAPLSLVSTIEGLLERKIAAAVQKIENTAFPQCVQDMTSINP
jgi:hypothetical protein